MLYKAKLNNSSFLWFHSILSLVYSPNSQNKKSRTVRCKKTHSIPIGPANAYISVCLREIWPVLFLVLERKFLRLLTWAHFAINPIKRFAKNFYRLFISITSPPPLIFGKVCCNFFYNGYGSIASRRYEGQIVWNACILHIPSSKCVLFGFLSIHLLKKHTLNPEIILFESISCSKSLV